MREEIPPPNWDGLNDKRTDDPCRNSSGKSPARKDREAKNSDLEEGAAGNSATITLVCGWDPWLSVDWVSFFIGNSTIDRSAEVGFQSVSVIQGIWRWWHRPLCHVFLVSQPLFWLPCFKMLKYRLNPDKDILKHRTSYVNQRIFFVYVCITQHQMISSDLPD